MASGTRADPGDVTEQLGGESVDVTEWIGMKHSNHLLHVGCRHRAIATGVGWLALLV